MSISTPGVVRVNGGGSLLRAVLEVTEDTVWFGAGPHRGLRSWDVEVAGGLPLDLLGTLVPVTFLARGHAVSLRGMAYVADVRRDVDHRVDRPLRFSWSSRLAGTGPLTTAA